MTSCDQLSVTKSDGALVVPCEPTPSHSLPLSSIDRNSTVGAFLEVFLVYKHGQEAAKVIKHALRKALVPYYPLAGRFMTSEQGEVRVTCTGHGVWFVEASADRSLEDMDWLDQPPLLIPKDQLFPLPPNPSCMSVMMQVTEFSCGGFVVGLVFDHTMADGIGMCQFMRAIGEISRGLEQPIVKPVWLREHIPTPPLLLRSPLMHVPCMRLECLIVDVSLEKINQLKHQFIEQTGERCSALDVTMAKLWQCRTRAIGMEPGVTVRLRLWANTRHLLSHVLPSEGGYYGNCVYPLTVTAPSGKIANGSLAEIVTLIRDSKNTLADEFSKWASGDLEEDPYSEEAMGYESMSFTDWTGFELNEIDYGWGGPAYLAPVLPSELELRPKCFVVKPPAPNEGCRLITICVKKEHLEAFRSGTLKDMFGLAQPPKKFIHAKM